MKTWFGTISFVSQLRSCHRLIAIVTHYCKNSSEVTWSVMSPNFGVTWLIMSLWSWVIWSISFLQLNCNLILYINAERFFFARTNHKLSIKLFTPINRANLNRRYLPLSVDGAGVEMNLDLIDPSTLKARFLRIWQVLSWCSSVGRLRGLRLKCWTV